MQAEAIRHRARADLLIVTEQGEQDVYLWEHCERVAGNAELIGALPEVQREHPDMDAVLAASLYHEAGWIVRLREGEISRGDVFLRPLSQAHRDQGAAMLERSLSKLLPRESLRRAVDAVCMLNQREIDSIEGRIVSEADNLDEIGVVSLWATVRRGAADGRGVQSVIDTWYRRREYRFWEARLSDSFHFAPVRRLAEQRLRGFEHLMRDLEQQHSCGDVRSALGSHTVDQESGPVIG